MSNSGSRRDAERAAAGVVPGSIPAELLEANGRYSMGEVMYVLTSLRQNHERLKLYRVSLSVIRFLSVLNFIYTILGVTFLMLALCSDWTPQFDDVQRKKFFKIGLTVSVFAPLASFVDLLALRGLQLWRRAYLLPWLFLYAFIISLIFANTLSGVFHHGFSWTYTVLLFCVLISFSAWRHVRLQYSEMARERPEFRSVNEIAEDLRQAAQRQGVVRDPPANDLPPKYEDLAPPSFAEAVAVQLPPVHEGTAMNATASETVAPPTGK